MRLNSYKKSINKKSINKNSTPFVVNILQIASLVSLAFAYPLFVLLSENAEFFIAHKMQSNDLYIFTALILLGPSLALSAILGFFRLLGERPFFYLQSLLIIFLITLIVMAFMVKLNAVDGIVALGISAFTGICFGFWFNRSIHLRSILTTISPINLLIPIVFLYMTDIQEIVSPVKNSDAMKGSSASPISVVLIIFDEFTITSLMDSDHNIDSHLFPNFAEFAKQAMWYRNATTVADGTTHAVPAILSGQYGRDVLPTYDSYPQNLFTILQSTHRFNVHESVTSLCPRELCFDGVDKKTQSLLGALQDSAVLYLHIITPPSYASYLPDISQGWTNFLSKAHPEPSEDRKQTWFNFLDGLSKSTKPSLNVMHILLPHLPFQYLPDGRNYLSQAVDGLHGENWGNDAWAVKYAWQRHLLQLSFVDKLLGTLVLRLKEESMFDDSLVIVTADHGVSFKPQDLRRPLSKKNYMDILPIPLFVKMPKQTIGSISDLNVETVDILPTIAEVLDIPLEKTVGGISVINQERLSTRKEKNLISFDVSERRLKFPSQIDEKYTSVSERIEMFGEGSKNFYHFAVHKNLIGKKVDSFNFVKNVDSAVYTEKNFDKQIFGKGLGPNFIRGYISEDISEDYQDKARLDLLLAVNGVISAKTKTFLRKGDAVRDFLFLVPESAYSSDRNSFKIYGLEGDKNKKQILRPFQNKRRLAYSVSKGESELRRINSKKDDVYKIENGKLIGFLDEIEEADSEFLFRGWAISVVERKPANHLVLFVGEKFIASSSPKSNRHDVVAALEESAYLKSGFNIQFKINDVDEICKGKFELYALSDMGTASRLSVENVKVDEIPGC